VRMCRIACTSHFTYCCRLCCRHRPCLLVSLSLLLGGAQEVWGVQCANGIRAVHQTFNLLHSIQTKGPKFHKPYSGPTVLLLAEKRQFMQTAFRCTEEDSKGARSRKLGHVVSEKTLRGGHGSVAGSFLFAGDSTAAYRKLTLPPIVSKYNARNCIKLLRP
jgi:hypothetical protein